MPRASTKTLCGGWVAKVCLAPLSTWCSCPSTSSFIAGRANPKPEPNPAAPSSASSVVAGTLAVGGHHCSPPLASCLVSPSATKEMPPILWVALAGGAAMHSVGGEPGRVTALATILHWPTNAAAAAAVDEDDEEEELVADRPMALSRAPALARNIAAFAGKASKVITLHPAASKGSVKVPMLPPTSTSHADGPAALEALARWHTMRRRTFSSSFSSQRPCLMIPAEMY